MRKLFFLLIIILFGSCNKKPAEHVVEKRTENSTYLKAWDFFYKDKKDSAFYYLDKAKELYIVSKDSFGAAKCLVNMAIIQESFGDNYGSIETSLLAFNFLKPTIKEHESFISSNNNNIGVASNNLKDYTYAEKYYLKALKHTDDSQEALMIKSNLANTYYLKKNYKKSLDLYKAILAEIKIKDEVYAKILSNFAKVKWEQNNNYDPLPEFREAFLIQKKIDDLWGMDASYSNFATYYLNTNKDSALYYTDKMYKIAKKLNSTTDQLEALENKIRLDNKDKIKAYFNEYEQLKDSLNLAELKSKNHFALIRFQSDKSRLENEKLNQENIEKQFQLKYHRLLIIAIVLVASLALFTIINLEKRKRNRAVLLAENEIKTNRLKTSKRVHDVVANGLYRVMTEIENSKEINKEKILYRLETMYENSRDISYQDEIKENNLKFSEELSELLRTFDTETLRLFIVGNGEDIWSNLNLTQRGNVFHIIQELMINMKKHSEATRVVLKFKKENSIISIDYSDNGVGFGDNHNQKNGLTSTVNRINYLKGDINFASNNNSGLKINMTFPEV